MNKLLWTAQIALALLFAAIGLLKTMSPNQFAPLSPELARFIGVAELLGAVGLILPGLIGIMPRLTALAAAGLGTIMILATGYHLIRGEIASAAFTLVLLATSAFVVRGRMKSLPTNIPTTSSVRGTAATFLLLLLASCQVPADASSPAPGPPAVPVTIVTVAPERAPIYKDYAAQTFARDLVEVRGRVDGYIEKRLFQTGDDVVAGQPLYILDLRPYQADVDLAAGNLAQSEANREFAARQVALLQAEADLAHAQANLAKAQLDVDRLRPLVAQEAAAQQDLDNALAALRANEANVRARQASVEQARLSTKAQIDTTAAQVDSNRAALKSANLNLEYATIHAPISGRIGESHVPVGGLVSRNSPQPLTTIVPLDVIWVRFKLSETEFATQGFRRNLPLELVLATGEVHRRAGRLENTVNQVDRSTGTIELQATFPNPQHTLLPGQFGRVRMLVEERDNVILVPQKSVVEMQGTQTVLTLDAENKVLARSIVTSERIGDRWVVLDGLNAGDRVITEGLQKAAPGSIVAPREER
jgi:membrane fusion protein (multidrug efflux system)